MNAVIKLLLLMFIGLVLINKVQAIELNKINYKDAALKQCVEKTAAQQQWHSSEQVTKLKCHGKHIKEIDDLRYFSQLSYLSLFNNQISQADLTPLTQLTYVNIANNRLTSIQLTHLSHLTTLYIFKNKLTTIDFTGLTALKKIRATNNLLNKLDISPLISLEKAYFFDNKLNDLKVRGLPKLRFMELRQNPMPDEVYDRYDELDGITIVHDGNADDWK